METKSKPQIFLRLFLSVAIAMSLFAAMGWGAEKKAYAADLPAIIS